MKLDLSDDQQFFQETVRRFVETETPVSVVRELADHPDGFERDWWSRACELGFTSFLVPEEFGGGSVSGAGPVDLAIIAEEVGRGVAPGPLLPTNVVAETIARSGSSAQRELLEGVIAGEHVLAWCVEEPARTRRGGDVELIIVADGDGFMLQGVTSAVEAAGQADHLLVTARSPEGLTQVLLPVTTAGVSVTPQSSLDLVRRFGRVEFDGVRLDADVVIGAVGQADADVQRQRLMATMLQCAEMAGATARVFEFTVEWGFDRHSFGRPLASYQALKHRYADMKLWLEASHAAADGAAEALATDTGAEIAVSAAKAYVGDKAVEIMQDCVQLHGGIGVTWEHDIHLYLRRATVNRGLFGTPEDHREILATAVGL